MNSFSNNLQAHRSSRGCLRNPDLLKMESSVMMLTGRIFTVEIESSAKILDIKVQIRGKEGFRYDNQILIFGNTRLDDGRTLADYKIKDKSIVHLVLCLGGSMRIFVRTVTCKTITLQVESSDTIENVKTMIWDKVGIPPDQQWLVSGHTLLEDDWTLAKCNIEKDSSIDLLIHCREGMKIFVKTLRGKTIKAKIQDKEGIPPHHQRLFFDNKHLEHCRSLMTHILFKTS